MRIRRAFRFILIAWTCVIWLGNLSAFCASNFGQIRGVTRNVFGKPMPWSAVILRDENRDSTYEVMSTSDGSFLVEHVQQGCYDAIAFKEGYAQLPSLTIMPEPGQRVEQDLGVGAPTSADGIVTTRTTSNTPRNFFRRFSKAYEDDWKGSTPSNGRSVLRHEPKIRSPGS